jgi:hypothetical protein
MNHMARSRANGNKKPAISSGFCTLLDFVRIALWWRRRELNPRPKIHHLGLYILILAI